MEKKTIYFHIGTHKTGSTAIQKFLLDNEELLNKNKFLYSVGVKNGINHMDLSHNIKLWENIDLDPDYNYIFSSEDFYFSFFRPGDEVVLLEHLVKQAEKFKNHNIKVIVYLRRQDLFSQSLNNEIIKRHGFTKEYSYNVVPLNYYEALKSLAHFLGASNILIRPYENSQFSGDSIYADFFEVLGLELTDEYQIESKVVNPSLTTEKMEFTRYINMLGLPVDFRNRIGRLVIKSALDSNEVSLFRKQDLISPKVAKELLAQYEEGNREIAQEFLGRKDGKLFYEEVAEDPNWKPFPGLTQEVALEILQKMVELDKPALEKLYQLIMTKSDKTEEFAQAANFLTPLLICTLDVKADFRPFAISKPEIQNPYRQLQEKLNAKQGSADILREVAFAFEQSGDIQTACKVMEQARYLRPQGPIIKQKLEEYRKQLNEQSVAAIPPEGIETINAIGHRDYVGGMWEEIGRLQFDFLCLQGLKPEHTLLDIACGSLRAGVHFINYLDAGNYLGIDKEPELINRGIEQELGKDQQAKKKPEFVISDRFEFNKFSKTPDYAIAQSLFTHLVEKDIKLCLQNLKEYADDKALTFFATFFECETPKKGELKTSHSHAKFEYTRQQMEQFGKLTGWQVKYIGDWKHLRGQKMMKYFLKGKE